MGSVVVPLSPHCPRLPLALVLVTFATGPVLADALPPGVGRAEVTTAAEPAALADRQADDAAAGRAYLGPTAITLPRGGVSVSLRAPLWPAVYGGVAVGVTDRVELGIGSARVMSPDQHDGGVDLGAAFGKVRVWGDQRAAIAVAGSVYRVTDNDGEVDEVATVAAAGVVATACNTRCDAVLSAHLHYVATVGGDDGVAPTGLFGGASVLAGKGRVRFLFEANIFRGGPDEVFLGYGGVRLAGRSLSFDAGIGVAAEGDDTVPWPVFGLAGRLP